MPSKADAQIILLDEARARLAKVARVDEAKKIRDQAEAIRNYAKQQRLGLESQNKAAEIKIRAERRGGELLAAVERARGKVAGRGRNRSSGDQTTYQEAVESAGLKPDTAHRWQKIASIPEPIFETAIAAAKSDADTELTTEGMLRVARTGRSTVEQVKAEVNNDLQYRLSKAIRDIGVLADFFDAVKLGRMTKAERGEVVGAVKRLRALLGRIQKRVQ